MSAAEQARPQIAHDVEGMSASRGQQSLGAPDRVLNVNIVAKHLGGLDALAQSLSESVLPEGGFAAMLFRGASPWLDVAPDVASQVPWELLCQTVDCCSNVDCSAFGVDESLPPGGTLARHADRLGQGGARRVTNHEASCGKCCLPASRLLNWVMELPKLPMRGSIMTAKLTLPVLTS